MIWMKRIQKFVNILFITCILMPVTLFIFPLELSITDGAKGASYLYGFGGPISWLTIDSNIGNKSGFIDAAFKGNTGISIHWLALLYSFFMIFVVAYLSNFIIKKYVWNHNRNQFK